MHLKQLAFLVLHGILLPVQGRVGIDYSNHYLAQARQEQIQASKSEIQNLRQDLQLGDSASDFLPRYSSEVTPLHERRLDNLPDTDEKFEYEVPLVPFQLYLEYDIGDKMSNRDEMMVLTATQAYLSSVLKENEPNFSSLRLYQFVRDYPGSIHYAKVAVSGSAYFFDDEMKQELMESEMMLSFLGEDIENYIHALQEIGMTHVVNAKVMSIEGIDLEYVDGKIVKMGGSDEETETSDDAITSDRDMSEDMRMMTLLLSLLIPGVVLCFACSVFALRSSREIKWSKPKTSPEAPVWQSCRHLEASKMFQEEKEEETVEPSPVPTETALRRS
jgi:hypothetical protein